MHRLCAVIAHHQNGGLVGQAFEQAPDALVDELVVLVHGVLVRVARHVLWMCWVDVLPQAVVDPVRAHIDEHEKAPVVPGAQQVLHQVKALPRHAVDLLQQADLV